MSNGLYVIMGTSLLVVFFCIILIFQKFIGYFVNQKRAEVEEEKSAKDIKVLEIKLPELKLKNKGDSLDENIKFIYDDESVGFSMNWGDFFE